MNALDFLKETRGKTREEKIAFLGLDPSAVQVSSPLTVISNTTIGAVESLDENVLISRKVLETLNSRIEKINTIGMMSTDCGWDIESGLSASEQIAVGKYTESDIKIIGSGTHGFPIKGNPAQVNVCHLNVKDMDFVAIGVPEQIKKTKIGDTYIGKQLMAHKDQTWFPSIDFEKTIGDFVPNYMVIGKGNIKDDDSKVKVNISTNDITKELAKKGMTSNAIFESIIMGELIYHKFGESHLSFLGHKADSDESGFEDIRRKYSEIESFLGIRINEFINRADGKEWIARSFAPYKSKDGRKLGVLRCAYSADGAQGGVCSLFLHYDPDYARDLVGFRLSLGFF